MFRFNVPLAMMLASSGLLAVGGILLVSCTAYSSETQTSSMAEPLTADGISVGNYGSASIESMSQKRNSSLLSGSQDSRRRNGRLLNQSAFASQPASSLDSYAAAYASANSPTSGDQTQDLVQSTVQANDANSYASFGEPSPVSLSSASAGLSSRGYGASSDYMSHSSNYYPGYLTPASSSTSNYGAHHSYHYPHHRKNQPLGYPSNNYERQAAASMYDGSYSSMPLWASGSPGSGGLMSSASSALSSWTNGFSVGEIVCTIIAISIGALILGAPFFLIYLALMGNFSGSGTLSLTNPTSGPVTPGSASTTVNGRRKRLAIFEQLTSSAMNKGSNPDFGSIAEGLFSKFSPFIDVQQISASFKKLVDSVEKYSKLLPENQAKKSI